MMDQRGIKAGREASWLDMEDDMPCVCRKGSDCCKTGEGMVLTPLDIFRIAEHDDVTPEEWIDQSCTLKIDRKSGVPMIRLRTDEETGKCVLFKRNRCSACRCRPDSCQAFPLERRIAYICSKDDIWPEVKYVWTGCRDCGPRTRGILKVREWLDMWGLRGREEFLCRWADALCDVVLFMKGPGKKIDDAHDLYLVLNMVAVLLYYEYDIHDDFYEQFDRNVQELRGKLKELEDILDGCSDTVREKILQTDRMIQENPKNT